MMRFAPVLILALGCAIVGWGLWYRQKHPPRIVSTGSVEVEDRARGGKSTYATRTVEIGAMRLVEVELPNGTWIDCAGDCREAVKKQHLEFWQEQQRRGN